MATKATVKCGKPTTVPGAMCRRREGHPGDCKPEKLKKRAECAVCKRLFWQGVNGATNELCCRCYRRRDRGLPDSPIIVDPRAARDKFTMRFTFNISPNQMQRVKAVLDKSKMTLGPWLRGIIEAELKVEETREAAGL